MVLKWTTASEINNLGFEIERCAESRDWRTVGFLEGKGTTTEIQDYSYIDDLLGVSSEKVFYRLKQIDYNGQFDYSSEIEVSIPPVDFDLFQNYPNPFNPSTVINYFIPRSAHVSLIIHNAVGQQIEKLVDEIQFPGYYQFEFDGSNLPSGIYFYSLRAAEYSTSKKMMLMK